MADNIETVKIATKDFECGYLIINKSDFDADKMKLYVEKTDADAGDKGEGSKSGEGDKDSKGLQGGDKSKTDGSKKGADAGDK